MCLAEYQDHAICLVGERGNTRLFHCSCQTCGHAILAVILESSGWVSSIGVMTDLEAQDAIRFQNTEPIHPDECVALYRTLETESGAFCHALMHPSATA